MADLRPEWLSAGEPTMGGSSSRYGMGVSFLCPHHVEANHSLEVWFANPLDGEFPLSLGQMRALRVKRLFHRVGYRLDQLTVFVQGHDEDPLDLSPCWRGWITEGVVFNSLAQASFW